MTEDRTQSASRKELVKEEYPLNLLLSVKNDSVWETTLPETITADIIAGTQYALSKLDEREQGVVYLRYQERKSFAEIGRHFGISVERVRQINTKLLRKLRYPSVWEFMLYGLEGNFKRRAAAEYDRGYNIGYGEGYEKGVDDAPKGITKAGFTINIKQIPIENLDVSVRAFNCLRRVGYEKVGDLVELTSEQIVQIKNLGVKPASEIAQKLYNLGVVHTAWDVYLPSDVR